MSQKLRKSHHNRRLSQTKRWENTASRTVSYRYALPFIRHIWLAYHSIDCKCFPYHEAVCPAYCQNCKGRQGVRAGVRFRVHKFHYLRSRWKMSNGETKNNWRGGYLVRYGVSGIWELCRNIKDSSGKTETGAHFQWYTVHVVLKLVSASSGILVKSATRT